MESDLSVEDNTKAEEHLDEEDEGSLEEHLKLICGGHLILLFVSFHVCKESGTIN